MVENVSKILSSMVVNVEIMDNLSNKVNVIHEILNLVGKY